MAQVTIYGPLVTAVLSLWPAPSEKWRPLLNPPQRAGHNRLGQVAQPGSGEWNRLLCTARPFPWPDPSPLAWYTQASRLKLPLLANKTGR